jgi:hypothetical protein
MTIIHMDTETVNALMFKMQEISYLMKEQSAGVARNCIAMDWSGASREEFILTTDSLIKNLIEKFTNLVELSVLLQKEIDQWVEGAKHFCGGLGPGSSWLAENAHSVHDNVWLLNTDGSRLSNTFVYFTQCDAGQKLIRDATDAGLMFVIIENGKEVGWLGDPNGQRIPIEWNTFDNAYGRYMDTSGNEHIELNTAYAQNEHLYAHTVAHEMQHAIDFNTDNLDRAAIDAFQNLNSESAATMSVDEIETIMENGLTEYVKSEVNSHDLGYEIDPEISIYENRLDASDGVYTKKEFDFVINTRDYETLYEDGINEFLQETFGADTSYQADVWVDRNGNLQVDIDQSRPFVPRIIDEVF